MNTLQKIIEEMKSDIQDEGVLYTWRSCLEYYVPKLTLLLNEETVAASESVKYSKDMESWPFPTPE